MPVRFAALAVAVVVALGLAGAAAAQKKFVTIASARPGGSWYITGAGWAEFLNKHVAGVEAKVEQSGGGLQNNKLVSDGKAEFAPSVARLTAMAMGGEGPFKQKLPNIRVLVSNWSVGVMQFSALEKSGLQTVCDLKGKRVTLGPAGGGGIPAALAAFKACGFGQADVTASFMSYEQGKEALLDGNVDAFLSYAAVPVPALKSLEATPGARWRLLAMPEDRAQQVVRANPGYVRYVVPGTAYGQRADTVTIAAPNVLIVNKDVPDDLAYRATRAMMEHLDEFKKIHPTHRDMTREASAQAVADLPFHPGALRYYKEAGLLK
ncbi:MAG: TAXI family TRAP transporter solute-binding subunit [Candidatus Rokuibacteriota bacterium]